MLGSLALYSCLFAAEGMFQGEIVDPPGQKPAVAGWIFVQGRNRMVRRVDVARAVIVPVVGATSGKGKKCGPECLAVGQEVRVTAEQDGSGEWHARRVQILRSTAPKGGTVSPSTTLRVSGLDLKLNARISQGASDGGQRDLPLRNFTLAALARPGLLDNHPNPVVHPTAYGEIHNYPMVRRYNERCPVAEKDRFSQECFFYEH